MLCVPRQLFLAHWTCFISDVPTVLGPPFRWLLPVEKNVLMFMVQACLVPPSGASQSQSPLLSSLDQSTFLIERVGPCGSLSASLAGITIPPAAGPPWICTFPGVSWVLSFLAFLYGSGSVRFRDVLSKMKVDVRSFHLFFRSSCNSSVRPLRAACLMSAIVPFAALDQARVWRYLSIVPSTVSLWVAGVFMLVRRAEACSHDGLTYQALLPCS